MWLYRRSRLFSPCPPLLSASTKARPPSSRALLPRRSRLQSAGRSQSAEASAAQPEGPMKLTPSFELRSSEVTRLSLRRAAASEIPSKGVSEPPNRSVIPSLLSSPCCASSATHCACRSSSSLLIFVMRPLCLSCSLASFFCLSSSSAIPSWSARLFGATPFATSW